MTANSSDRSICQDAACRYTFNAAREVLCQSFVEQKPCHVAQLKEVEGNRVIIRVKRGLDLQKSFIVLG